MEWFPPQYREAAVERAALHSLPSSARLIPCCGHLPLLTDLYFHVTSPIPDVEYPFVDFASLTLPQLRVCDHGFPWSEDVIEELHRVQPALEEFHSRSQIDFDLPTIVRLFTNVKKFIFDFQPWIEEESDSMPEETIITALEQAKSLTCLTIYRWYPMEINSYVRLAHHLLHLSHLIVGQFDSVRLLCQGIQMGTRSLIDRLIRLEVIEGREMLTSENMEVLAYFTSLMHLKIDSTITDVSTAQYPSIYEKFNDLTFLPRIKSVSVVETIKNDPFTTAFVCIYEPDNSDVFNHCRWNVVIDGNNTEVIREVRMQP